ncbi:hypothetical protein C8T65DRAFT_589348 [Cerioporus squamosus]|nr:hypothetical protein C8T65DRAFT_589348 [Cerioporus squamosus]
MASTATEPHESSPWLHEAQTRALQDVFTGFKIPQGNPHARRAWHHPLTKQERAVMVLNFMKGCGFDSLGDFLAVVFDRQEDTPRVISGYATAFLTKKGRTGTYPIDILRLWHQHLRSEKYTATGAPESVSLPSLPRYARLPNERLQTDLPAADRKKTSTRSDILDWALSDLVLPAVDRDLKALQQPEHGFTLRKPSELTWQDVLSWDAAKAEHTVATQAPVLFAVMSTACVSKRSRKNLESAIRERDAAHAVPQASEGGRIESGDPDEEEELDIHLRRDPWLVTTIHSLSALHVSYQYATAFPTFMSVNLFVAGVPSVAFRILSRSGMTLGYNTTIKRLRSLAMDASHEIRRIGACAEHAPLEGALLWDNVNKNKRVEQTTLAHQNIMQSGTAATFVRPVNVPPGALRLQPWLDNIRKKERLQLTVKRLREDIDWSHIRGVGIGTILRTWLRYIPQLSRHRAAVERIFTETHAKHKLPLRKSDIYSLRCSGIDESTTVGTWELLQDLIKDQLSIPLEWLNNSIVLACGDQLTVHRVRKVKLFRKKPGETPAERAEPFLPLIQPFHMKLAEQRALFHLGYKPECQGKLVFGMHHDAVLLGRENVKKEDFYPRHAFLSDRFDALVLEALRLVCEEKTSVQQPADMAFLESIHKYFGSGGQLASCSFEELSDMAGIVYERYMTNRAYDDASKSSSWQSDADPRRYGPKTEHQPRGATAGDDMPPEDPEWTGDAVLRNDIAFMRLMFWYLEFCVAVAEGDPGRVCEIIKLLRFSFWGAGCTNYGNELLELACCFMYEFLKELKEAILNNYFVNPSGRPGHWHELDLLQEHFNYWLKRLFNTKSLDFDSPFLRDVIGLNLRGFCDLRGFMLKFFGLKSPGKSHTDADNTADIDRLGDHYRTNGVLRFHVGRNQPYHVENEFALGMDKLYAGQLQTFLERTTADGSSVNDDVLGVRTHYMTTCRSGLTTSFT